MSSIQNKIFRIILNNRHLLKGQLRRNDVFDFNTSIDKFRDDCEKGAKLFGKLPKEIIVSGFKINNIYSEWITTNNEKKNKVILYVHGGGYVSGSCEDHRAIVSRIVKETNIKILLYEYRLAPENHFPAALDDSLEVYNYLLSNGYNADDIIIVGESAGGGLALAILLALKNKSVSFPKAAVAISPWTDLKCTGESYKTKNKVSLAPLNSWFVFSKYYYAEKDPEDPLISPLYGDLSNLPELMIVAGEDDELFDDSVSFVEKAKSSGVKVDFIKGKNMVHCYPYLPDFIPEAKEAFNKICRFIESKLL